MSKILDLRAQLNQLKDRRNQSRSAVKSKTVHVDAELLEAIIADLDEIVHVQFEHNKAIQLLMRAVTGLTLRPEHREVRQLVEDYTTRTISTIKGDDK